MLDEALKSKIAQDLEKSGFGSELKVRKIFAKHISQPDVEHWYIESNTVFFDKDENKSREIDLKAYSERNLYNSNDSALFYHLVCEVKKSRHPWLVFKEQGNHNLTSYIKFGTYDTSRWDVLDILNKTETFIPNFLAWHGSGIHEAFKGPDQPSKWYSAFTSVLKATVDKYEQDYKDEIIEESKNSIELSLYQPVVILDSSLMSVELDESNDIQLEELMFVSLPFEYRTSNYPKEQQLIDVVSLNYFDEYLRYTEGRIWDVIYRIYDKVENYTKTEIPESARGTFMYRYASEKKD